MFPPKAGNQYALAAVSDGTAAWKVCLPRGMVKARQRELFVSEDAILPMDEHYRCGKPPIANQRNLKSGIPMLPSIVRRNVYRANQRVLYSIASFPELKKSAVGNLVADILHILSAKQQKAEKERRSADELARAAEQRRDNQALEWRENYETIGPALDFVQKTTLDPIEESPELFEQYTDCLFEVTEKMCGLNHSVYCDRSCNLDGPIGVCVNGQEIKDDPKEFHWSLILRPRRDIATPAEETILAEAMKTLDYVNGYNIGIAEVQRRLKENGNPQAEFDISLVTAFRVRVQARTSGNVELGKELGKEIPANCSGLYGLLRENGNITLVEMAQCLELTEEGVRKQVKKLVEKGLVKRVGGRKFDHWEVSHD